VTDEANLGRFHRPVEGDKKQNKSRAVHVEANKDFIRGNSVSFNPNVSALPVLKLKGWDD